MLHGQQRSADVGTSDPPHEEGAFFFFFLSPPLSRQ
jgi:hypothetical protein